MTAFTTLRSRLIIGVFVVLNLIATIAESQVAIPAKTRPDFNGDGKDDLAIGVPGENTGAGGVQIIYGSSAGLTATGDQFFSQNSTGVPGAEQDFDQCGTGLTSGDFNGDGYVDLAMGCPGEDAPSADSSGAVIILYGSSAGLTATGSQYWGQNSPGITGGSEPFDRCGTSLASGDINRDGFADLIWGCPGEDIGDLNESGAVNVLFGSAAGLTATGNRFLSQDTAPIPDDAESGDNCGQTVAAADFNGDGFADIALGCPREDIGLFLDAGAVSVAFGASTGISSTRAAFLSQDTAPFIAPFEAVEAFDLCGQGLATGDFNNDGRADVVFGCPGEDRILSNLDVGSLYTLHGTSTSGFSNGRVEMLDADSNFGRCGAALTTGRLNNDAFADVAIGCTDANNGSGHVHIRLGRESPGLGFSTFSLSQNTNGLVNLNFGESGDNFGHAVAAGDFDGNGFSDLAVGVPNEDISGVNNLGVVNVIYFPLPSILDPVNGQLFRQGAGGIVGAGELSDHFGSSLNGSGSTQLPGLTGTWEDDVESWCRGPVCHVSSTFTVINPSRLPTPHVAVWFYLSDDQVLDDGDLLVAAMPVKPLDPGESQVRALRTTLAPGVGAGGRYLIAYVDAEDVVYEVSEENNIIVSSQIP